MLQCIGLLVAPSGGWAMSALPPLSGDKPTSGERSENDAIDPYRKLASAIQ